MSKTYFIAYTDDNCVWGVGGSREAARSDAVVMGGYDENQDDLEVSEASEALYQYVLDHGGENAPFYFDDKGVAQLE